MSERKLHACGNNLSMLTCQERFDGDKAVIVTSDHRCHSVILRFIPFKVVTYLCGVAKPLNSVSIKFCFFSLGVLATEKIW